MLATKNYRDFQVIDPTTGACQAELQGAQNVDRALPEDSVRILPSGQLELVKRAERKPLVGVLHLTSKYMYGMTSHGVPMYLCEPMNRGFPNFRVACKERDRSQNLLVSFQFESWDPTSELPRGSLLKILGGVEDPRAESEALAILSCPWTAPRPSQIPFVDPAAPDRIVLSTGTFNIDPPGCLDIDDVLTIEPTGDPEQVVLWITIADVSEMVKEGSKEYEIAEKIGATTYQDGRAVRSMLHRDLSEKSLSLLPGELRYGLSLRATFHLRHGLLNTCFRKVLVQNQKSYTYESAASEPSLAKVLTAVSQSEDPHKWIEVCMLLYNQEAAGILKKMHAGLLRGHDAPFEPRLKLLQTLDPSLQYLSYQSAKYISAGNGETTFHWGLQRYEYTHATSPLRRFADLVNQQIIKNSMDNMNMRQILDGITFRARPTDELAVSLNRRQAQIQEAERNYQLLKAIQTAESSTVKGVYLWTETAKATFYVSAWKSTIRFLCEEELEPGKLYTIQYYCDRRKALWKERMIYRLVEVVDSGVQNSAL